MRWLMILRWNGTKDNMKTSVETRQSNTQELWDIFFDITEDPQALSLLVCRCKDTKCGPLQILRVWDHPKNGFRGERCRVFGHGPAVL